MVRKNDLRTTHHGYTRLPRMMTMMMPMSRNTAAARPISNKGSQLAVPLSALVVSLVEAGGAAASFTVTAATAYPAAGAGSTR